MKIGEPSRAGGVRRYGNDDLRRPRFVRMAQDAGFTLAEVAELPALDAGEDRARAHALAVARVAALDARIQATKMARDALARLASQCADTVEGQCPILSAFDAPAAR